MTGIAAGCLGLAAAALAWPWPGRRARWRRLFPPAPGRGRWGRVPVALGPVAGRFRPPGGVPFRRAVAAGGAPAMLLATFLSAVLGTLLGGPVAGLVAGVYGAVAARLVIRRAAGRTGASRRAEQLDLLAAAAADLRAGLPAGTALAGLAGDARDRVQSRVRSAMLLAERTGAPLADVLERIEADARGADRARAAAAAQTAGSRATAWLLAGLPLGGIGLGYAIGADPLAVLLRTPIGAACACGAVGLQLAGLAWAGRIIRGAATVRS